MAKINSRSKGQRGEREFANLIRRWFPESKRGIQSRAGGDQADVEGTPWWLESKNYNKHACFHHLRQAEKAINDHVVMGNPHRVPVVALRESGDPRWALLVRLDDFPRVAAEALGAFLNDKDKELLNQVAVHLSEQLIRAECEEEKKARIVRKNGRPKNSPQATKDLHSAYADQSI